MRGLIKIVFVGDLHKRISIEPVIGNHHIYTNNAHRERIDGRIDSENTAISVHKLDFSALFITGYSNRSSVFH